MTFHRELIALPLAAALAACAAGPETGDAPPASTDAAAISARLLSHDWRLERASDAAGQSLPATGDLYRLRFTADRLDISGGCNDMFGGYRLHEDMLTVEPLASTRKGCEPPRMQADAEVARLLQQPLQIEFGPGTGMHLQAADGSQLQLRATPRD
ncbi:META domain-containing protein [Luteimonas sp. e5]